ncbi:MAG: hypothetical protein RBT11_16075 [Desulfobacterales bacterium]|jgi:hypothetical protein|nr:hypothetical protein [Desulfobacterales bacterium]
MTPDVSGMPVIHFRPVWFVSALLAVLGGIAFLIQAAGPHPERAWQAYLINFLLWSAISQGAFLFSALMHVTRARWSGPMAGLAEAFAGFFPVSFLLFLILAFGAKHVFPWMHADLHGKEVWLNLPFLMTRNAVGLILLYGIGLAYLFCSLKGKRDEAASGAGVSRTSRKTLFAVLYIISFALVLSLIGFDLVMSLDPHWYSTLFGAYTFIKAFYVGLAGLIILAAIVQQKANRPVALLPAHFHDVGKLFFGFCLVWADFFYCQLVVIWYGNIPEESGYVIARTMVTPWQPLAWAVFIISFVLPFCILLNKKIKTRPVAMSVLCSVILVGIWLEHLLLVGPALFPHAAVLPLGVSDVLISLGFLGLMTGAVTRFLNRFPELVLFKKAPGVHQEAH